jgi:protein phosphatase
VLAVADGLGGQRAGEVAAAIAIEAVARIVGSPSPGAMRAAAEEANRTIRRMAGRSPERAGMGTTLTAALLAHGRIWVAHVGDSRAYLFREDELQRLTSDHSVVAELVRRGDLSVAEAERHPQRNVITRALGAEPVVRVDQVEVPAQAGDIVLLCSDGLCALVPDSEIQAMMLRETDLDACAGALTAAANEAGGIDNITVVLARIAVGAQAEVLPSERPTSGDTAPHPVVAAAEPVTVIGKTPPSPRRNTESPTRRTSVLEHVDRPRRGSRARIPLLVSLVLLAIAGAAATWVGSRSYFLEADSAGQVHVRHGLPFEFGPVRTFSAGQPVGVSAQAVRAAEPNALSRSLMGRGEATLAASRLVWRYGLAAVE